MRDGKVAGMITETDLFKVFLEMMGAREVGIRVTALVDDQPGILQKITNAVSDIGGSFISFGQFTGEDVATKLLTFKVTGVTEEEAAGKLSEIRKTIMREAIGQGEGSIDLTIGALALDTEKALKARLQDILAALGKSLVEAKGDVTESIHIVSM